MPSTLPSLPPTARSPAIGRPTLAPRPAGASSPPVLRTARSSGQLSLPFFHPGSRHG